MNFKSEGIAKRINQFGAELYKNLESTEENVIFSPFSIQTCLTMAYLGAGGKTEDEIAKVLNYSGLSVKNIVNYFQSTIKSTEKEKGLELVHKIYVKNSYKLKDDYKNSMKKFFKSEVESLNFIDASKSINRFVERKTNGRIKNLMSEISEYARVILVNVIYFKGKWKYPFHPDETQFLPFKSSSTQIDQVEMMYKRKKLQYARIPQLDSCALELPYKTSNITMLIILPNEDDGISSLERRLNEINLSEITSKLSKTKILLHLPKFEFETFISLTDALQKMGMNEAFDGFKADFSKISEPLDEPLYISDVVHKAFIKVDEEGAEAAAVTKVELITLGGSCSNPSIPTEFRVDHPFVFILKRENLVLFMGVVKDGSKFQKKN